MFSSTTFKHPTFQKHIKQVLWLARMESLKTGRRSVQYVTNRHGRNILRIDVYDGNLVTAYASGSGAKDFSKMINKALEG